MKSIKKATLVGVFALTSVFGASAASASAEPCNVSGGNTLATLSNKYGIDLASLLTSNPQLNNPNFIWKGMQIVVPAAPPAAEKPSAEAPAAPTAPEKKPEAQKPSAPPVKPSTPAPETQAPVSTPKPTTKPSAPVATPAPKPTEKPASSQSEFADQVVTLVNQERSKAGLKPLASDSALAAMALDKAKDMYTNNYFDHNSPTYGSPFDMMKSYGISYTYAGENIAKGQRTPQEVMNSWMNSQGHRENILSPNFTKIGVAYYNGEWVQEFIAN
ncbi:CAP domain-containing protein [Paenibacillus chitinolyticus]|uniref:CAP domain-containing protein n=1 Tax=Paenibacillus chitinolyticus TaxID=79263 RepID=UPI003557F055